VRQRARPDQEAGSPPVKAGCAAIGTSRDCRAGSEKPCATASVHGKLGLTRRPVLGSRLGDRRAVPGDVGVGQRSGPRPVD
jgi:hypothetical protein